MEALMRVSETLKSFKVRLTNRNNGEFSGFKLPFSLKEARLSGLRPPSEFFDYQRISRPADFNQASSVSLVSYGLQKL